MSETKNRPIVWRTLDAFDATLQNDGRTETVVEIQSENGGELLCYANPTHAEHIATSLTAADTAAYITGRTALELAEQRNMLLSCLARMVDAYNAQVGTSRAFDHPAFRDSRQVIEDVTGNAPKVSVAYSALMLNNVNHSADAALVMYKLDRGQLTQGELAELEERRKGYEQPRPPTVRSMLEYEVQYHMGACPKPESWTKACISGDDVEQFDTPRKKERGIGL